MRATIAVSMLIMLSTMAGAQAQTAAPTGPSAHIQTAAYLPQSGLALAPNRAPGAMMVSDISTMVSDIPTASSVAGSKASVAAPTDTRLGGENSPDMAMALLVALAMGVTVVRRSGGS